MLTNHIRKDIWLTVFSACICALAVVRLVEMVGGWILLYAHVRGWV